MCVEKIHGGTQLNKCLVGGGALAGPRYEILDFVAFHNFPCIARGFSWMRTNSFCIEILVAAMNPEIIELINSKDLK